MRLWYKSLATKATATRGSAFKSLSGQTSAIKASLKRSVKEKVTSANSWWGEKNTKSSGFANGVSGAMAAWAVKNTSPTSRGNQSMIGMGAGAVSSLPGIGGLVYGLGGALGVISGGAQVIGGIAATFTGAGAAVGIPMILKGAVEVVVSVQVLSAAVKGEESKAGREATAEESTEETEAEWDEQDTDLNDVDPDDLPEGWTKTENNGFIHIRDERGRIRIRIDPPDNKTPYPHKHYYDSAKNSVDVNGNIANPKSPEAHIPLE